MNGGDSASCSLCDSGYNAVNGACVKDGACNNAVRNACAVGSLNDIADNDNQFLWECLGINGGNKASCSMYKPVDGVCGSLKDTCASGDWRTSSESTTATTYWYCDAKYGGIGSGRCSFANGQTGVCGSADGTCTIGTKTAASPATDSQYNYWYCAGTNGGDTSGRCSYYKVVNGTCGSANGQSFSVTPTAGLCSTGTPTTVVPSYDTCANYGSQAASQSTCNYGPYACGTYMWVIYNAYTCGMQMASTCWACALMNTNTAQYCCRPGFLGWNWKCVGENGGSTASCSAR
jgi:hypothetical protein